MLRASLGPRTEYMVFLNPSRQGANVLNSFVEEYKETRDLKKTVLMAKATTGQILGGCRPG